MAWAELSDVRCYYELVGEGDPLVMIPGLGGNCRVWDSIVPFLADQFTVILVDNRGLGRSTPRRPPRTLADYSADIAELLDKLQLDRAHVLGLSLGGIIAQRFAIDHPSRVDRLVLVSCAARFTSYLHRVTALLGHSLRRFPRSVFVQTMEMLTTAPFYLDANAEEIDRMARERVHAGVPARAMGAQLRALLASEINPADYKIINPTLVVAAEHDHLIPNCYARRMADDIPGSQYVLIPGAGHNPMVEMPELVLPIIARFLKGEQVGARSGQTTDRSASPSACDDDDNTINRSLGTEQLAKSSPGGRHP
jgi:pimeloyl-ACP methyl ester carboxylesterase